MAEPLRPEDFIRGANPPETPGVPDDIAPEPTPEQRPVSHAYHDDTPAPIIEPTSEPTPPPPPSDPRDSRIDQLQQTVNALIMQQRQPQQPYYPPQQPQQPQQPQGWQAKEFLTKEDAAALLTAQDPSAYLNKTFNTVAQSVYDPMYQELQKRDQIIMQMHMQSQQRYQQEQAQRVAEQNQQRFYALHPDMEQYDYLVPMEVQAIAYESQSNPAAYINKSDIEIYQILSDRVRAKVEAIRNGGVGDTPTPAPAPTRRGVAQRTSLERGGGTRASTPPPSKDPNKNELTAMARHLKAV